ncbi:hypothetical protein GCM10022243_38220 [Saccharothrix violaceirubra]|uniref:Uncharacterized protein n=1 Tax=Saccharothrix violaceirubra TaxID=413306 RepID=A0A7W7T487_9PSEU|nr:hypothetical protein [Saccharothrix violaceirubra]MBB4966264.1 hypothetical protein [Saccharothrix violaceirubra]
MTVIDDHAAGKASGTWWGDLIRVLDAVRPGGSVAATVDDVAELLGLTVIRGDTPTPEPPEPRPSDPSAPPVAESGPAEDLSVPPLPPELSGRQAARNDRERTGREHNEEEVVGGALRRQWREEPPPMPWTEADKLGTATVDRLRRALPHTPLLRDGVLAGIVGALVARPVADGEIDVERLVEVLAHGRPVAVLPRRVRHSLRFGAHLLLDRGEAMFPFRRDQDDLEHAVGAVVGRTSRTTARFVTSPFEAGKEALPQRGRPVLVLSGFGIGGAHADPADWARYARRVRSRGSRLVGLVPFPEHRFPGWLRRTMPVVTWDRSTTVGAVHRAVARRPG